jgi:hypothetical protein
VAKQFSRNQDSIRGPSALLVTLSGCCWLSVSPITPTVEIFAETTSTRRFLPTLAGDGIFLLSLAVLLLIVIRNGEPFLGRRHRTSLVNNPIADHRETIGVQHDGHDLELHQEWWL